MFISDEIVANVSFAAAQARLANMVRAGTLQDRSAAAYDSAFVKELRVGPSPMMSRLVRAQFRDLVVREGSCLLTFRWEATGPGGSLLPVLDADITVTPAAGNAVNLKLDGSYRPPLGPVGARLDRAIMHRAATATIRAFMASLSDALANPDPEFGTAPGRPGREWLPEPDTP